MKRTIGFRDGLPYIWDGQSKKCRIAQQLFEQTMSRAQLDKCDELVEKSSNPEVVKLAQRYIENWRKEVGNQ